MMAYCPECGSEVAPNNTFCAYCGIALQPHVSSVENIPSQPDTHVPNVPDKDIVAETSQERTPVSHVESEIQVKNDDPIPPTPFILEDEKTIEAPRTEEPVNFPVNDNAPSLSKNTIESWSMKTDSIELDAISKELLLNNNQPESENIGAGHENTPNVESEKVSNQESPENVVLTNAGELVQPKIEESASGNILEHHPNPILLESQEPSHSESVNNPFSLDALDFSLNKNNETPVISENPIADNVQPVAPLEDPPIVKSQMDLQSSETKNDPDFNETMPYTPADYASHSLKVSEPKEQSEDLTSNKDEITGSPAFVEEDNKATEIYTSGQFAKSIESHLTPEFFENNQISGNDSAPKRESLENSESNKSIEIPDIPIPEPTPVTPVFISILPKDENFPAGLNQQDQLSLGDNLPVSASEVKQEPKDGRSYTSPNFGTGDTDGNKAKKLKPLEEGTILNNRYEIVRKIGGGGMGAVYLASDRNLGGVLRAVKEMVQSSIEDEQQDKAISDFKRESTILSALEHSAIPTIFDYFFDDKEGRFYLVMRYISGGDLAARLRSAPEGKIEESTVTDWGIQVADVLSYLHNQEPPIVYRDLKPSNIMIDGNTGRIMLIDFGIARLINSEQTDVTAVGTMGYAPPELYRKNVEPRSDIFSLGSTMFHLLTGADPQSNPLLIFDFNKNPRPRQINSRLSDQIEQILMRSVELDAANRFTTAAEMRDILKTHLDNLLKGAVTYGVVSASGNVQAASNLPVFCGFCGQKIVATDQFCPFCGSLQPTAGGSSKLQQIPVYSAPKLTARVLVIGTSDLDSPQFSLDKETNLVGRRDPMSNIFPEVDLSKFDPQTKISRKHARIWRESDVYMLEDLGSSNGTVLISQMKDNVRLLPRQPHVLANGDKIKVGDTTLHFFIG